MKILTKDFTTREKVLLLVLLLVIIVAAYYLFVYRNVQTHIEALQAESQALENQLAIVTAQADRLRTMSVQMENDTLKSYMPSYNSSKIELDFLNSTLSETEDYLINFTNLTRNGDQIRREFVLQFTAKDYAQAERIIKALEDSEIRCLIGDFQTGPVEREGYLYDGHVQVSLRGCFYETMYDGTVDKELPEDEAKEE